MRKVDLIVLWDARELIVPHDYVHGCNAIVESSWDWDDCWIVDRGQDLGRGILEWRNRFLRFFVHRDRFRRLECVSARAEVEGGVLHYSMYHGKGSGTEEFSYNGRFKVYWKSDLDDDPTGLNRFIAEHSYSED